MCTVRMVAGPASRAQSALTTPAPDRQTGVRRGRGAVSQPPGRFEVLSREVVDDGWQPMVIATDGGAGAGGEVPADEIELPRQLQTFVKEQRSTRAISRNDSPDIFFNQSINPYRGCEHGCVYCYARPGHAYEGLSPGLDFETRLFARPDHPALLAAELDRPGYRCEPITIGAFTDAYQPIERQYKLTRRIIETLLERRHPFTIITKSALITRDLDLLSAAAARNLVACFVSVTTLDPVFARAWEPRASAPHRRLQAIEQLAGAGVPTGIMAAPMVPFLNDDNLEAILEAGAVAGARSTHYTVLRLPNEVRPVFEDWLQTHFPDRYSRVMNRIRDLRGGGRVNDSRFHHRMRGLGPWAELIARRFRLAARRHGLRTDRPELSVSQFRRRPDDGQIDLFDA
jgi:DNA repair photolyase